MCLVAFSWQTHPEFPLLISANRDEFFDRPTAPLHQWPSGIYAGKDLRGGGTWMGFHPNGKWSLLTNYRDFHRTHPGEISRGKLVQNYLEGSVGPEAYLELVHKDQHRYDGFNLLVSDGEKLFYLSNYGEGIQEIKPGIHGLSNGLINDPWPKVELAKNQLAEVLSSEVYADALLSILKSTVSYPAETLPTTGVPEPMEIALSAQLIRMPPRYGTVSASSVLKDKNGRTVLQERSFDWDYGNYRDISFSFHT